MMGDVTVSVGKLAQRLQYQIKQNKNHLSRRLMGVAFCLNIHLFAKFLTAVRELSKPVHNVR
jgi:hypothetical protein